MEIVWIIYLIDILSSIDIYWSLFVGPLVLAMFFVPLGLEEDGVGIPEAIKKAIVILKPYAKWCAILVSISILINSLSPSRDTAYKMLAAYGVTELIKSEEAQNLGGKSLEVLEKAMDEYLGTKEE